MLQDDSGELTPVKLDPALVSSDNAIIVLDEINDTCWVFIGRHVNMPTRMHALRMGKSVAKSGYKIGVTTIGMGSSRIVEMLEKDDSDADVVAAIAEFRDTLSGRWAFDDKVLAFRGEVVEEPIAGAPEPTPAPEPVEAYEEPTLVAETIEEEPEVPAEVPAPSPEPTVTLGEKKLAYLLYSAVKHSDLIYTEKFERDGKMGVKVEAPGTMVIEVIMDGDDLKVDPATFGDSEMAQSVKSEYETWLGKV
ncbi:MAG: hypothetical protein JSW61_14030 [Candidatus Thorarchaeota archaeon]|nr:MAG: hypothetical protein JSW61_14030 [Candidatus Thorarchaeota archaeon]